ncbi:MAG: hypothetical protein ACJAUV_000278 [Flavobacteriales bacterium]|jgi:hypothetical protein
MTCLKYFTLLLFLTTTQFSIAQMTQVNGRVTDLNTGDPMPFVNISFNGTKIGTTTNFEGYYTLQSYYAIDSIAASFVGYTRECHKIKKDIEQTINFKLDNSNIILREVIIKHDKEKENPAHPILRNIIRYKAVNNREKLEAYQYEVYNKVEFDLNNLTEEFKNRKIFKPFEFIFDHVDSAEDKSFLPIFITESVSDFYYRKSPKNEKEFINATKLSGIENESVSQFLGDMYQNVNIYDNNIKVFRKSFVSPISNSAFTFYKFYLTDSAFIDNNWCYRIDFKPRRKQELTFTGNFWVNDTTYAIKVVEANIAEDANINFVKKLQVRQEFDQVEKEVWMITQDQLLVDFNITKKTMGFYGRRSAFYKNFVINKPKTVDFYEGVSNIEVAEDVSTRSNDYWQKARQDSLTNSEKAIYSMVDSIKDVPQFRTIVDVVSLLVSGYHNVGKIRIGPYFSTYSFNVIEGNRVRLGGKTSEEFSKNLELNAYGAYGFRDEKFKYGGGFKYFLSKKPRVLFTAAYSLDMEQLGQSQNAFQEDNILASAFRRNPASKLTLVNEASFDLYREWFHGLGTSIGYKQRVMAPRGTLEYKKRLSPNEVLTLGRIVTSEVTVYARFAYKEKFISSNLNRISLGTKYPAIEAYYSKGFKGLLNSGYDYDKLTLRVSDRISLGAFGNSEIALQAGKYWGTIPYTVLEIHTGNETFISDPMAFNTMNYFEFVSDEYVQLFVTHHWEGFFLNKIPLFRKLKWREVTTGKAVIGSFNQSNTKELLLGENTYTLGKPYAEASVGIENIFKILRVDALWRLSYLDHDNIAKFGIRMNLKIDF